MVLLVGYGPKYGVWMTSNFSFPGFVEELMNLVDGVQNLAFLCLMICFLCQIFYTLAWIVAL